MLLTIGLAAWVGWKIDSYFQLKFPAFLLSFVLVSFVGTVYQLYRTLNK